MCWWQLGEVPVRGVRKAPQEVVRRTEEAGDGPCRGPVWRESRMGFPRRGPATRSSLQAVIRCLGPYLREKPEVR